MHYKVLIPGLLIITACSSGGPESNETNGMSEHAKSNEENTKKYERGQKLYDIHCTSCHQQDGKGLEGTFPPLANSDYLLADKTRAIKQIINGSSGEMIVNGVTYNGLMPPPMLSNEEVCDVAYYVLNAWGNNGGDVSVEEVQQAK